MAEAGYSLSGAVADGTSGTVVSALGQKRGLWTYVVTGHSAVIDLAYSQDAGILMPWTPIVTVTAGSVGGAATGMYDLNNYYRYLRSRLVKAASAAGGSASVTDYLSMVN